MIVQNIKLSLKNMNQSKTRTLLSLLGIVIGVASVLIILTLGNSASNNMLDNMKSGGLDIVPVNIFGGTDSTTNLNSSFGDVILKNVNSLESYETEVTVNLKVKSDSIEERSTIKGVSSGYLNPVEGRIIAGSFFNTMDNVLSSKKAVIGKSIADKYFPNGNAIGQNIKIKGEKVVDLEVIGIVENDNVLQIDLDNIILVPYNLLINSLSTQIEKQNFNLYFKIIDGNDPKTVCDNVNNFLEGYIGKGTFYVFSSVYLQDMVKEVTGTFSLFLSGIAAISLLVGGIGIMNIMLVSVVERTKEIGIRKALGATPKTIRRQFITEAAVLTLIGGLLGVLLGFGISKVVCDTVGWIYTTNYLYAFLALVFSSLVGIFFGWYPARKASNLDPIVALNYE